jgi:hypothetical protein
MLDDTGPYDFVVDSGAQFTSIDEDLASELGPKLLGPTHVTGVATYSRAEYAQLRVLEAGENRINEPLVTIRNLHQFREIGSEIRGILGENFLEHFDMLIDYRRKVLCLDNTKQMQKEVKGERIELTKVPHADTYYPFTLPSVISIRTSGMFDRQLLLQLDSGTDLPLLFECGNQFPQVQFFSLPISHNKEDAVVETFALLQPQDILLGNHSLKQVSFVTPVTAGKVLGPKPDVDGVLPTALFRSVFISHADHFAILQP